MLSLSSDYDYHLVTYDLPQSNSPIHNRVNWERTCIVISHIAVDHKFQVLDILVRPPRNFIRVQHCN